MVAASSSVRRGVLAALASCCLVGVCLAEETSTARREDENRKLERVREEMRRLQSLLDKSRTEAKTVLGDLQRMDLEIALRRQQILILGKELEQCRDDIQVAQARLEESRQRLRSSESDLETRVRALYRRGPWEFERVLLTAEEPAEVIHAYRLESRAALADQERARRYRESAAQWRQALGDLEQKKAALTRLRSEEIAQKGELEAVRSQRSGLLSDLRRDVAEQEGALADMAETRKALERLVRVLSEGGAVGPGLEVGFERYHGLLPWPVPGKILVGFGAQKNPKFETLVPHPGLDLSVTEGEPIHVVHEGIVAFSDWFKGFGNLIVVEHGQGYMSVYAHAADRLVSTGDRVTAGQVIAKAGDTGSLDGPKLYFEIIKDGKPENPVGWLTRK